MPKHKDEDLLQQKVRRMGEPSWLILHALIGSEPIPGIEIINRVEDILTEAGYPARRLDPSTLHYALKRMEDDGFVYCGTEREVDVPSAHGGTRRELRPVFSLTGLGARAIDHRRMLDLVMAQRRREWGGLSSVTKGFT